MFIYKYEALGRIDEAQSAVAAEKPEYARNLPFLQVHPSLRGGNVFEMLKKEKKKKTVHNSVLL